MADNGRGALGPKIGSLLCSFELGQHHPHLLIRLVFVAKFSMLVTNGRSYFHVEHHDPNPFANRLAGYFAVILKLLPLLVRTSELPNS